VAELDGDDLILCQITSRARANRYAVPLADTDFDNGRLQRDSYIRTERLFTADSALIAYAAGTLKPEKMSAVTDAIVAILRD
jgi:mRNA interferase MazF